MEALAWKMEDKLQDLNVFVNGLSGEPAHSDSYMTIIDIDAFENAWKEVKDLATTKEWLSMCDYWIDQGYLTPTLKLLGTWIKRKVERNEPNGT